jgi:cysteinyl-tRNA synthetase
LVPLRLYNTATRKKETFSPLVEGKVGIYVCGVTVYDLCHVGHARSTVVFDVLVRHLRMKGFDVKYVRNFTDLDDKIIKRAQELGKETDTVSQEYIEAFYEDMDRLGVLRADWEPRATEHIEGMIEMITTLLDRGYAYVEGEDVFFSVGSFKDYGSLSGRKLEDMQAGKRIAVDDKKRHPMDFVLWKGGRPGEPQWPSPWGPGRPGWHLECSVMSNHYLGPSFDIHGGGQDLLFPHHENERAQSIAANGGTFARYWVHNGFVTVESEKMSKSLGNFLTIRDALKSYHPEVLRLFLLSKHYRTPLDFSKKDVFGLQSGLVRIYRTLQRLEGVIGPYPRETEKALAALLTRDHAGRKFGSETGPAAHAYRISDDPDDPFTEQFVAMMDDDLNTAGAIGLIFEKAREVNRVMDASPEPPDDIARHALLEDRNRLLHAGRVLGLFQETTTGFFEQLAGTHKDIDPAQIEELIQERADARTRKDWKRADEIRDHLRELGVVLEDGPRGTTWRFDV